MKRFKKIFSKKKKNNSETSSIASSFSKKEEQISSVEHIVETPSIGSVKVAESNQEIENKSTKLLKIEKEKIETGNISSFLPKSTNRLFSPEEPKLFIKPPKRLSLTTYVTRKEERQEHERKVNSLEKQLKAERRRTLDEEEKKEILKQMHIKELQEQKSLFQKQEKQINYLETRIQELASLIKQRKEKIVGIFTRLLPDKEKELNLIQNLVVAHLEYTKAKKQSLPSVSLRRQRDKIRDELEELLGGGLEEEVESSLNDCEELVSWELELKEKLDNKTVYIEEQKQTLKQITDSSENENKIVEKHEETQQNQIQQFKEEEKTQSLLLGLTETKPTLKRCIGKGGYGEVYYGKWKLQDVAVKKLYLSPHNTSESDLKEIRKEINLLKNLKNRYIIQYYDTYSDNQELFIIMDFAENGTLTKFINNNQDKEHDWDFNNSLIKQIVLGLAYIHQQGIIHRDLKSMNILLTNGYQVKISDFGLSRSKAVSSSQSKHGTVGTLRWMAPELLKGEKYSEQSDIYALGMIVWEITAQCATPFKEVDNNLIYIHIINNGKETIPSNTPQDIQNIIQQCWKDNPTQRISLENILEIIGNDEENLQAKSLLGVQVSEKNSEHYSQSSSLAIDFTQLNIEENQQEEQQAQIVQKEPFGLPSSSKPK